MFRIEAFVDDKNLPRVLHALTGLILGTPKIQPVANAAPAKDGAAVKAKTNGDMTSLFEAYVKKHKIKTVTPSDMKHFAVEHGWSERSYSLILTKMLQAKHLRKKPGASGKGSAYIVTGAK